MSSKLNLNTNTSTSTSTSTGTKVKTCPMSKSTDKCVGGVCPYNPSSKLTTEVKPKEVKITKATK